MSTTTVANTGIFMVRPDFAATFGVWLGNYKMLPVTLFNPEECLEMLCDLEESKSMLERRQKRLGALEIRLSFYQPPQQTVWL